MAQIIQPIILEERIAFASIKLDSLTPLMIAVLETKHQAGNPKYTIHNERQGLINFHRPYPVVTWELIGNQYRIDIYHGGNKQENAKRPRKTSRSL